MPKELNAEEYVEVSTIPAKMGRKFQMVEDPPKKTIEITHPMNPTSIPTK